MQLENPTALGKRDRSERVEQTAFYLLFAYFAIKAIYFAISIRNQVFPDEATWFGMVEVFSRSYLPPVDSPESYPLALITHIPNLYFFLMGKILTLNIFGVNDLIFLRLINVGLGLVTIFFSWRLICLILPNVGGRILCLVMVTNTLMFTFTAGAVNYDNLSTLFAVLSLYYITLFLRERTVSTFLWVMVFLLAGMLTKNVFLPYAAAMSIVLLVRECLKRFSLVGWKRMHFQSFTVGGYGKLLLVLLLLAANANLYVGNMIRYGHLLPSMDQVLTVDDCLQNRLFARGYVVNQYKKAEIDLIEAQRLILQIRDPGDRAVAFDMLSKVRSESNVAKPLRLGRLAYSMQWAEFVLARLYGVAAHLALYKSERWMLGYYVVFGLGLLLFFWRFLQGVSGDLGGMLFVCLFYTFILMQIVNYNNYIGSGFVGIALTGRYLFPILVPLYLLIAHGLMSGTAQWWQWVVGLLISLTYIWGGFPWFLMNAAPVWYVG